MLEFLYYIHFDESAENRLKIDELGELGGFG
jgi:hypothetical protein